MKCFIFDFQLQEWTYELSTFVCEDERPKSLNTMNTKKFFYGILAFAVLFVASCTNDSDGLYDGIDRTDVTPDRKTTSVDRTDITPDRKSIDRTDVTPDRESVDRTDITPDRKN